MIGLGTNLGDSHIRGLGLGKEAGDGSERGGGNPAIARGGAVVQTRALGGHEMSHVGAVPGGGQAAGPTGTCSEVVSLTKRGRRG